MGRKMQYKDSNSYWESAHADCSWFILNIIKNQLKKRLKQRKRSRSVAPGKDVAFLPEKTVSSSAAKSSTGSQKKEKSKKWTRDHKSSTCPPNVLSHNFEASSVDPHVGTVTTNGSMMAAPSNDRKKKMSLGDYLVYNLIQENMKEAFFSQELKDQHDLIHAKKLVTDASAKVYKDFLDSVDIISIRKDLLLALERDLEFHLAKPFHQQQVSSEKMILTGDYEATKLINKLPEDDSPAKGEENLCIANIREKRAQFETKTEGTPCTIQEGPVSSVEYKLEGILDINPTVVKQEKNYIAVDAILHKVPRGHRISKELKNEILIKLTDAINPKKGKDSHESGYESDLSSHSLDKHHRCGKRRISSLTEPLDRDSKHPQSERLNLRTEGAHSPLGMKKSLGRVSSLPDLRSYSNSYHNDEFSDSSSPTMLSGHSTTSHGSSAYGQNGSELDVNSESPLQLDKSVDNMMQENLIKVGEDHSVIGGNLESGSNDDDASVDQEVGQIERLKDAVADSEGDLTTEDSELKPGLSDKPENVVAQKEDTIGTTKMAEATQNFLSLESLRKHLKYEISHHMDPKDKAKFNYVRDLLELSGFIGNEFLQAWHSDDLPLDQLVYKEMECDPHQDSDFDHQFLFDLINEVLLETYGKSCSYCPLRLSSLSHSRMPVGRHVLNEIWTHINSCLNSKSNLDQSIDEAVSIDLAKAGEWVNPQFQMECVALEIEELIFHDILEEILCI